MKVLLRQPQSPGDVVVMTGAVRDLKLKYPDIEINVDTTAMELWENNPHITRFTPTDKCKIFHVDYDDIHNAGKSGRHFSQAFNISISDKLKKPFPQTSIYPDIHMSKDEKNWSGQVEDHFGYKGSYWIINSGYKSDFPLKDWGHDKYQKVVDLLHDKVQFVQVGEKNADHTHKPLKGTLNLIGKTDLRQFIRLCYNASGSLGPVSMHMHLMGAFQKPCVVINGGREPWRWESYPNHRYLSVNGTMDCCKGDGCWKSYLDKGQVPDHRKASDDWKDSICKNLSSGRAKCMEMITSEDVAREIERYILGGMA